MKIQKHLESVLIYIFFGIFLFLGFNALSVESEQNDNLLRMYYLDVGQGDATLIETPDGKYILIDGGPDKSALVELGEIIPIYRKNIDLIILTHPHADHLSGLSYIIDRYKVNQVYINGVSNKTPDFLAFTERLKENKVNTEVILSGQKNCYKLVCFEFFWPDEGNILGYELNDTSLIFNVNYGESDFVFFGDASTKIQESIISRLNFDAEVIKISHHGSKTGTSEEILNKITPEVAVISVGENNSYNHPAKSVLELLSRQKILRTDKIGTITIKSDGKTIQY